MHTWNVLFLSVISAKLSIFVWFYIFWNTFLKSEQTPAHILHAIQQAKSRSARPTDSPARSCGMQTRPPQVVWCIDLEACRQDRVITERAHYAIPPSCRGMEVWEGRMQCMEEESAPTPRRRQPQYQTAGGEEWHGGKESKKQTVWEKERKDVSSG